MKHVTICRDWKEKPVKESVLRLIERCKECGITYIPQAGEVCNCEEPKVTEWDGIGWRPEVELSDADKD